MLIEMDDNTSITVTILGVFLIVALGTMGGCRIVESTEQKAIAAGMVQRQMEGSGMTYWTKP